MIYEPLTGVVSALDGKTGNHLENTRKVLEAHTDKDYELVQEEARESISPVNRALAAYCEEQQDDYNAFQASD